MSDAPKDTRISAAPIAQATPFRSAPAPAPVVTRSWSAGRTRKLLVATHLVALVVGVIGAWLVLRTPTATEAKGNPNVTLETFERIKLGMTYGEVQGFFGQEGFSMSWNNSIGQVERIWRGSPSLARDPSGPPPEIRVHFQSDKVSGKRAQNLK